MDKQELREKLRAELLAEQTKAAEAAETTETEDGDANA